MPIDKWRNFKLVIAYEGTAYHGWQVQPNGITVQEVIQRAIGQMTEAVPVVHGSGRTDAGVHAWGQVANFQSQTSMLASEFGRGLNALLPADIVVRSLRETAIEFHARKAARGKTYLYCIHNCPVDNPFTRRFS